MEFFLLSPDDNRMTQPIVIDAQPGGEPANPGRHDGKEWLHILEGEIVLTLEEREPVILTTGDTAWFPGQQRHGFRNSSDRIARVLSVTTPPNL
ncbi:cupin domain-containing protein [Rhodococcus triatomae]|nr:XRE family transcriptional regulator [Rhodococcus triatomae BKS 15-14]